MIDSDLIKQKHSNNLPPLFVAVRHWLIHCARFLLFTCHVNVNEEVDGFTALHIAIGSDHIALIELLLSHPQIDVNYNDGDLSPLHFAIYSKSLGAVRMLLKHRNIRLDVTDECNRNAIMLACQLGYKEAMDLFLLGPNWSRINFKQRDEDRSSISHYACKFGDFDLLIKLIETTEFSLMDVDYNGHSPFDFVCSNGHYSMVKYMMVDSSIFSKYTTNDKQSVLASGLRFCSGGGWLKMVKLLFEHINLNPELLFLCLNYAIAHQKVKVACEMINKIYLFADSIDIRHICQTLEIHFWSTHKEITRNLFKLWLHMLRINSTLNEMYVRNDQSQSDMLFDGICILYNRHIPLAKLGASSFKLQILYHAIEYGLSEVIEVLLTKFEGLLLDSVLQKLDRKGICLMHFSTKKIESMDLLCDRYNHDINNDQETWAFKKWYEINKFLTYDIPANTLKQVTIPLYQVPLYAASIAKKNLRYYMKVFERIRKIFHFQPGKEDLMIKRVIHSFMTAVSEEIRRKQPMFVYRPKRVGSSREGTRPFKPDEFDYVLICEHAQAFLNVELFDTDESRVTLKVKDNCSVLSEFRSENGLFDVNKFKTAMDTHFKAAVLSITQESPFHKCLYVDPNFYEQKTISCMHLKWRGEKHRDMEIKVDLVPAFTVTNYKPLLKYTDEPCNYYVFCKPDAFVDGVSFPVAYSDVEAELVRSLPDNGQIGFKLAKAMRVSALFPSEIQCMLEEVFSIEDCPRTYILKTIAIICNRAEPIRCSNLSVEEWALLIFSHLYLRLIRGQLFTLFTYKNPHINAPPLHVHRAESGTCMLCPSKKPLDRHQLFTILSSWLFES